MGHVDPSALLEINLKHLILTAHQLSHLRKIKDYIFKKKRRKRATEGSVRVLITEKHVTMRAVGRE